MKQIALLLALAATGLALFLTFSLLSPGPETPAGAADAELASSEAPERPAPEPAELQTVPEAAPAAPRETTPAPERTELAQISDAAGRSAVQLDVKGRVELPAGMPADDGFAVHVFLTDPALRRPYQEPPASLHGQSPVDPRGDFALQVPETSTELWLVASGKFVVFDVVEVQLPLDEPLVLTPELGGYISVDVTVPPGADLGDEQDDDPWAVRLIPDQVALASQNNPFSMMGGGNTITGRRVEVDPAGLDETGGRLSFEIRGVQPAENYSLTLVPETLAAMHVDSLDVAAGQTISLEWTLGFGSSVSGRVTDLEGRGLADVEIEAVQNPFMFGQGGLEVRETETDEQGRYTLAAVRPGKVVLRYEAEGYLDRNVKLELADGQVLTGQDVQLDAGSAIAGRVTWPDGTGVADVEVEVEFDPSFMGGMEAFNAMRGASGEGDTDAEGNFRVTGLGKGPFVVTVEAERDEDADGREWRARASAVKPDGEDLLLVLEPPMGVAGRVVDDLGDPVTAFSVHARTKTSGMIQGLGAETADGSFEHEEGRFFLEGLRTGTWEILAHQPGYGLGQTQDLVMPALDGEELVLVLERAASIAGVVVDSSGNPVAGAAVGRKRSLANLAASFAPGAEASRATTDEEGRFTLEGLASGSFEAVAEAAEFAPSKPVAVELLPAQTVEDVVLALRTGGRILGVIYDDEGDPWAGQTVLCQDPTLSQGQHWATSDAAGEFVFDHLAPGSWQVMTFPRDSEMPGEGDDDTGQGDLAAIFADMKFTMAEVEEGKDAHVQLGAKPANPVRLTGVVTAGGEAVAGTMLTFVADGVGNLESLKMTSTDKAGRFDVELTKPGRYVINVQHMEGTGQQQNVEMLREIPEQPEAELDIELPVGGITGVVKGPDGRPVPSARVTLGSDGPIANGSFTGGNYAEIWTDEKGRYELRWLRPGEYSVAAGGGFLGGLFGESGEKTYGRQVRRGVRVDEGRMVSGIDFRLSEPGKISGRVVDLSGAAVAEAAIFLRDDEGNPIDRISGIVTDSGGRFEYSSLEPGAYQVVARTGSQVTSEPVTARVREGQAAEVEVAVDDGSMLIVSLTDREGNHVRCEVSVTDSAGNQVNGLWSFNDLMRTFSSGDFSTDEQRVGPLPPGKYKIKAVAADGRDAHKTVTLTGQPERKVKLRLD